MKIGIVLGSASDRPVAAKVCELLEHLGANFEVTVASAHRTPDDAARYAETAADRGLCCIIAIAGLSAALGGLLAAHTLLPVIGLPVECGALNGTDALYSLAQMPPGVPVGTVGINGAANAALLALRIAALSDPRLAQALKDKRDNDARKVRDSRNDLPWPKPEL